MVYPRRTYSGYHGVFGVLTGADKRFLRVIYIALAALTVLALVVDAVLSPLKLPAPRPAPYANTYNKDLSWETMALYYLLGALLYALVMVMVLVQDGTIQRMWFRWRWSLWQRHSRDVLSGGAPRGLVARWALRLYDPSRVRLDTFYQWLAEANAAFEGGRLAEAVEAYRRALGVRPSSVVARANLGAALGRLGRHEEALEEFLEVLGADGSNGDARKNAALATLRLGRPREAHDLLRPHLEARPRDAEAWWLAARCRADDPAAPPEAVVESLRRACRLDPARRADLASEPAFAPYLEHPAVIPLLAPAAREA